MTRSGRRFSETVPRPHTYTHTHTQEKEEMVMSEPQVKLNKQEVNEKGAVQPYKRAKGGKDKANTNAQKDFIDMGGLWV